MQPVLQFLIGIIVIALILFALRRVALWRFERKFEQPVRERLDWLLSQVADPANTPLNDLHIVVEGGPGASKGARCYYNVYPSDGPVHMWFTRLGSGDQARYRAERWHEDLMLPSFPPYGLGHVRSAWFVDRMKRLCDLLETYPCEMMLSTRARDDESGEQRSS